MTRLFPDRGLDVRHRPVDERLHLPLAGAAAHVAKEVREDLPAVRRVRHLGVELEPEDRARLVLHRRQRAGVGRGERHEVAAHALHLVAVAHPDGGLGRVGLEERVRVVDRERRAAVLAGVRRPADLAAQVMASQLHPVADAEHGDAEVEDLGVAVRRAGLVDARRARRRG